MNLQIRKIVLYSKKGQIRTVDFKLGAVNIITGKSRTGKTAIIDIIDYCLGRSNFKVFEGVNRQTVAFYGIVLQVDQGQVFLAKPPPSGAATSQSRVFMRTASEIVLPPLEDLKTETNDKAVTDYLSRLLGISPNKTEPGEGRTTQAFEATIDHTKYYLFQDQNLVANRKLLFYRQDEEFIPQHIKDTMPYFLGAVQEERLQLIQRLRNARRQLALARRRLTEAESIGSKGLEQARALLAEAEEVGIVTDVLGVSDSDEVFDALRRAAAWTAGVPIRESGGLEEARGKLQEAENEFKKKLREIREAEAFERSARGYAKEAEQQEFRLQAIGVFDAKSKATEVCPVCQSHLSKAPPPVSAIAKSLEQINRNLQGVRREQPRLHEHLQKLREELEILRASARDARQVVNALVREREMASSVRDANARAARVAGRISFYLDNVKATEQDADLHRELEDTERLVKELETQLAQDEIEDLKESVLSLISTQMTDWAERLGLEFVGNPYRLDAKKLTVVADTPERPIPMDRMGSGENWLGCHLISLLSLHQHFIRRRRPVPNFLLLDQPSQVYFPSYESYKALEGETSNLEEIGADVIGVRRMFDFLFSVTEKLHPNFQIIVTEHANLEDQKYQDALVEKPWRGGHALIPAEWLIK